MKTIVYGGESFELDDEMLENLALLIAREGVCDDTTIGCGYIDCSACIIQKLQEKKLAPYCTENNEGTTYEIAMEVAEVVDCGG